MNRNHRVAVLVRTFSVGGAERVAANIASALANSGYAVDGICLNEKIVGYPVSKNVNILGPGKKSSKLLGIFRRIFTLRKVFRSSRYDAIVDFSLSYKYLKLIGLRTEIKYLVSERNYPLCHYSAKQFNQVADVYKLADLVVFQTAEEAACFDGLDDSKIRIIPNAVIEGIGPKDVEKTNTIITAARLDQQKNLQMMIMAFDLFRRKNPDYRLEIFGEGIQKDYLLDLIKEKGLESCVTIRPHSINIHDEMRSAKMFLSTSNYEGIQNSLLEALTLGVPCVATDCLGGGARLLLKNAPNWLVDVNDANSMANVMNDIVTNYDEAIALAKRESEYLREKFSTAVIYKEWVSAVDSLWGDE